jgi:hypothetical protein
MAKRKSLMDALSEYQEKNEFGRAQKKEEREKKMAKNATTVKTNTKKAFSTQSLLKTDKVKAGATHRRPPSAPPPVRSSSSRGSGSSSSSGGSSRTTSSSGSTNKGKSGTTGRSLPSNPQLHSQRPGKKDPESGVSVGRTPSQHQTGPSQKHRNDKGETRAEERARKQEEYNQLQRRRRSTGSSNNKSKLINGKLHEWKNGKWVKVRM